MSNIYVYDYDGFDLAAGNTNGVSVERCAVTRAVKDSFVDVEGRDDGYIGTSYTGFYVITLNLLLKGDTYADYETKKAALLAAFVPGAARTFTRTASETYTANVTGNIEFVDAPDMVAASRTVVMLKGRRD